MSDICLTCGAPAPAVDILVPVTLVCVLALHVPVSHLPWISLKENPYQRHDNIQRNPHPTVKPTDLMAYLCRLITPPNGTILDPFMGSGSTGKAAIRESFNFIGCELDPDYCKIAEARIEHEINKLKGRLI